MDVREKLVELIFDSLCRHVDKSCKLAENIADDLIANGVTVQEWISVKDRLPDNKEHDWVLAQVVEDNGYMHCGSNRGACNCKRKPSKKYHT